MNFASERDEIADVQARLDAMPPEQREATEARVRESWAEADRKDELRRQLPAAKDKLHAAEANRDGVADRWDRVARAAEEHTLAVIALDRAKAELRDAVTSVEVSFRDLDKIAERAASETRAAADEVDEAREAVAEIEKQLS